MTCERSTLPKEQPPRRFADHGFDARCGHLEPHAEHRLWKRGQFMLDNILGMPVPPATRLDIPALEASEKAFSDHDPTFREVLEVHRNSPLCSSCHSRMDPLGLSLENFNALGMYREKERGQPINASGKLLTGESFHDMRDLKEIIKKDHTQDFYRCLTEKLMTYALGRGLEYYDVEAVDRIVAALDKNDGKFSALLSGVVESVPFQERRNLSAVRAQGPLNGPGDQPEQHTQVRAMKRQILSLHPDAASSATSNLSRRRFSKGASGGMCVVALIGI